MGKGRQRAIAQFRPRSESMYYMSLMGQNYNYNYIKLESLICNLFKWTNLPDGIPPRYVEKLLIYHGAIAFYRNELGLISCGEANITQWSRYDEPLEVCIHDRYETVRKIAGEFEIIYNTFQGFNSIYDLDYYARKLAQIDDSIDENLGQLKFPYFVTCPEGQVASVQKMFDDKRKGKPLIVADKDNMRDIKFSVLGTEIKNYTGELFELSDKYQSRFLNHLGIDTPSEKKERLLTDEVNNSSQLSKLMRSDLYKQRLEGVERVNKTFNTNIIVEYNEVFKENRIEVNNNDI